jgi:hypothetical protein
MGYSCHSNSFKCRRRGPTDGSSLSTPQSKWVSAVQRVVRFPAASAWGCLGQCRQTCDDRQHVCIGAGGGWHAVLERRKPFTVCACINTERGEPCALRNAAYCRSVTVGCNCALQSASYIRGCSFDHFSLPRSSTARAPT